MPWVALRCRSFWSCVVVVVNIVPWRGDPSEQHVSDALADIAILSNDIAEGVTNVGIGVGLVMHSEAQVHCTIQVGRGFGFRECRALDGVDVCHVYTIHDLGGSAKNV